MTHAWMAITSGRWRSNDGGTHNLELVANMLCQIVGFELPFPHVFEDERLSLEETPQEMATINTTSSSFGPLGFLKSPFLKSPSETSHVMHVSD